MNLLSTFTEVVGYIGYILLAVLILLVMITVHEFGHYLSGKILKFNIEEFSIGFGPKLYQRKKKDGELFSVRLLPLGGYCSFYGEGEDNGKEDERAFNGKPPWKRIIVLLSGVFMNYVLALLFIVIMFGCYGQTAIVGIDMVETTEYKTEYLLQSKDIILKANGKNIYMVSDLMSALNNKQKGEKVDFTVRRHGQDIDINVVMRCDTDFNNIEDNKKLFDALGFYYETDEQGKITKSGLYNTSVRFGVFDTVAKSFDYSFKLAGTIFSVLGELFTGRIGISSMGGTVTTITVTANAIKLGGLRYLLNMACFIGVNLAVFNLLPIPALDGSRVVFCLIEWIFRKPVNRKVENIIHTAGFVLILILAVIFDLQRCF